VHNIGTWYIILQIMSVIAIVTNCAVVVFASDAADAVSTTFDRYDITTRFIIFIVAEHGIILLKAGIGILIPDIPIEVQYNIKRQDYFDIVLFQGGKEEDLEDPFRRSKDDDLLDIDLQSVGPEEAQNAEKENKPNMIAVKDMDAKSDIERPRSGSKWDEEEAQRLLRLYNLDEIPNRLPQMEWDRTKSRALESKRNLS